MSSSAIRDEERGADEQRPLLRGNTGDDDRHGEREGDDENASPNQTEAPTATARRLYLSHFLSTWNSRVFEFGAVQYLATIFPGTLLPMSIYALTRGLSAIVFAPSVGLYIDTGNRMQVVRLSIGKLTGPPPTTP
jgi:iron-regulated transporter 1